MKRAWIGVILLLGGVLSANAQEAEPPLVGLAGLLETGTAERARFEDGVVMQLFAFDASAGDGVAVEMRAEEDAVDPFLILLSPGGEVIAVDDDSGEDLNARIETRLDEDGVYLVLASTFRGVTLAEDTEGDYSLEVQGNTPSGVNWESWRAEPELTELALNTPVVVQLDEEAGVFLGVFPVQDAVSVGITALSAELDTLLYVFDAEGNRIALDDDGADALAAYSAGIESVLLDEPGLYVILVTDRDYTTDEPAEGSFELLLTRN
ncbi:MAG: hypothetical protein HC915_05560 [Anaerolineae bacterium]|nr:hypothetical protein [Anaerolineae bacterium]